MNIYEAKVREIKNLTPGVKELSLELPKAFNYQPGQYVGFQMEYTARSYSMVSTPKEGVLRFCIKLVPDGIGSEFVGNLKVGDRVNISGPYGKFVLDNIDPVSLRASASERSNLIVQNTEIASSRLSNANTAPRNDRDLLFIATGVGIAPVVSLVQSLFDANYQGRIILLFGLRHEEDIFYHNIFKDVQSKNQNFTFIPMLSQPHGGWKGERGRVTDHLKHHVELMQNRLSFICGSQGMVIDVQDILLKAGNPREDIRTEIFY